MVGGQQSVLSISLINFSIKIFSELRRLILSGDIAGAINQVEAVWPGLLEQNKELALMLKCQQYVEHYAKANHVNIPFIVSLRSLGQPEPT